MPDLPGTAITAAAVAIHDLECPDRCEPQAMGSWARARAALEAAAPDLRAQGAAAERARLLAALTERQATLAYVSTNRHVNAVLFRDIADLLDGDDHG